MIEVRSVSKTYGGRPVVDQVSFDLAPGGVVSLIGPNGAGKSTLLALMARLTNADGGQVLVDGQDVRATDSRALARRLAVLRQDNHLASRLSVRELVEFGRYPHCGGRLGPADRVKVDEALDFLDMGPLQHRYLDQLSGGQRQRAHVAMVLAQDTDYLLLDEPLTALDMRHAVAMMRLLRRAADEWNRTVVLVVHDINFASAYSDRILAMKDGRLIEDGTPDAVMSPAVLETIFDVAVRVDRGGDYPIGVYYR